MNVGSRKENIGTSSSAIQRKRASVSEPITRGRGMVLFRVFMAAMTVMASAAFSTYTSTIDVFKRVA